jgi:hypothetical protein
MSLRQFLDVVPKFVRTIAFVIGGSVPLIGLAVALVRGNELASIAVPITLGLVAGAVIATWILGLGYVYADARRRAMPPILWTLIAAFIPNLLGFLLYFALRRPIGMLCPHCGQAITAEQRFCSWCGSQGSSAISSQVS